jgi:uncharacterized protein (TIGR03067 family)
MLRPLLVLSAVALWLAGHAVAGDAAKDQDKLQGTWKIVAGNEAGTTIPAERVKGTRMVVAGNTMSVQERGEKREMTFKLDPLKEPRAIDLTTTTGKDKGATAPGIYSLEGNTLKIAFAMPGKERPVNFAPRRGSGEMLFVMKRIQP